MRRLWIISSLLMAISTINTSAQFSPNDNASTPTPASTRSSEDWNRVRALTHDEEINVFASGNRHVRCLFARATDDYLLCEPAFSRWHSSGGEYRFDRADVDKIRLEQGEHNFRTTVGVMALVGTVGGAAATNTGNGGDRVIGGLAGGLAGMFAGIIIAGPVALFTPGHLVYERPRVTRKARNVAHSRAAQPSHLLQQAQ
jgi:hypothetical protein